MDSDWYPEDYYDDYDDPDWEEGEEEFIGFYAWPNTYFYGLDMADKFVESEKAYEDSLKQESIERQEFDTENAE